MVVDATVIVDKHEYITGRRRTPCQLLYTLLSYQWMLWSSYLIKNVSVILSGFYHLFVVRVVQHTSFLHRSSVK